MYVQITYFAPQHVRKSQELKVGRVLSNDGNMLTGTSGTNQSWAARVFLGELTPNHPRTSPPADMSPSSPGQTRPQCRWLLTLGQCGRVGGLHSGHSAANRRSVRMENGHHDTYLVSSSRMKMKWLQKL